MELTNSFNEKLANGLEKIKKDYPDLKVKQLDLYSKMNDLNYQDACISDFAD